SNSGISGDKTEASLGGYDYWVVKLDGSGNIIWQNTIGGNLADELFSVQQTNYGGYILGGQSYSSVSGDKMEASLGGYDYWVVKLDGSGNIIWQNTIGGNKWDRLRSVQQTSDGGYILGGYSASDLSGDKTEANQKEPFEPILTGDYWIVKLSPDPLISTEDQSIMTIPDQLTVFPAYPNPFNPSTTIRYGIESDSRVTIEIHDISGKQILTLLNNTQTQGWYSVVWNGTNQQGDQAPAGVYFSKITSGNEVITSKLMLLK
ncbi:MAG: T9SS type A sorting domain-containing protein, partial [Candidatus Neomarinimicrobiota bacterium]